MKQLSLSERIEKVIPFVDESERGRIYKFFAVGIPLGGNSLGYGIKLMDEMDEFIEGLFKKYNIKDDNDDIKR